MCSIHPTSHPKTHQKQASRQELKPYKKLYHNTNLYLVNSISSAEMVSTRWFSNPQPITI